MCFCSFFIIIVFLFNFYVATPFFKLSCYHIHLDSLAYGKQIWLSATAEFYFSFKLLLIVFPAPMAAARRAPEKNLLLSAIVGCLCGKYSQDGEF